MNLLDLGIDLRKLILFKMQKVFLVIHNAAFADVEIALSAVVEFVELSEAEMARSGGLELSQFQLMLIVASL